MQIEDGIQYFKRTNSTSNKFSILIPSWNNLPYLQLCIKSIRENSYYDHQIIVHINDGTDGTKGWVIQQSDIDYSISKKNIGVCYALNICSALASTDYILYMNDDMYACKNWDKFLWDEINSIGHKNFFLSATAIEPKAQSACSIEKNYGNNIESFNESALKDEFDTLPFNDWSGSTWPPNVLHKDLWNLVGGYSTEFSPGMYSDPDFSMKLWRAGVRLFKGMHKSRVYHFSCTSTKRVKKNKGYYQFIAKWGITSSTFTNKFLHRGKIFKGCLNEPKISALNKAKNFYKCIRANIEL